MARLRLAKVQSSVSREVRSAAFSWVSASVKQFIDMAYRPDDKNLLFVHFKYATDLINFAQV
jgi:hypothetical protein